MINKKVHFHWPIIGHEPIIEFLQKSILNNKISHAYLFHGPEHVGKRFVAESFSLSLICESLPKQKESQIPCLTCPACQQALKKIHPDIYLVESKGGQKISINQIRELEHKLSLRSFLTSYKIALIDQAELLTIEASNALLKTLEEPTPKTVIILIANNINLLPATIISRCQLLKFNLVPYKKIEGLVSQSIKGTREIRELTRLSSGRVGLAYYYLKNPGLVDEYKEYAKNILEVFKVNSIVGKFRLLNEIIPKKGEAESSDILLNIINIWSSIIRDLILIKMQNKDNITNLFTHEKLLLLSKKYSLNILKNLADKIKEIEILIKQNINANLVLENLIINI